MKTSDELLKLFNQALDELPLDKAPSKLYDPIRYVLSMGGKRIRPTMCLMACELFSDEPDKALIPALALEVFHNFTLLHDDIMDKAPTRRNMDCVHIKWDENVAILSGDAMQILAYQILGTAPIEYVKACLPLFSQTAIEVCEGQQFDMDFETQPSVSVAEYMNMIRLKTAVLLAASLKMGAIAGGANSKDADLLYDFGLSTGLAFQLKDDLLDVYGCSETFGKRIGGDIACNKKTFMLINALDKADPATRATLDSWLSDNNRPEELKITAVTNIYNKLNIKELCILEMEKHQKKAFEALAQVSVPESRKANLIQLANELTDRDK
ncbi:MAG TPA: polyprenyl synthetase family protein [Bacteroidales bacterium]|nr:polyprenyl synthetase family protein [Bacteroidales bacterium]